MGYFNKMKLDLLKQIIFLYKDRLIDGLISWFLVFGLLIFGFVIGTISGLSGIDLYVLVLISFMSGLFLNYNRLKGRTSFDYYKEFKSILWIFVIFTGLFWFNYIYGSVLWIFIITTIGLVVWKMWRSKEFLGEQMAYIEIMLFGKPQTKKWKKKIGVNDEKDDK